MAPIKENDEADFYTVVTSKRRHKSSEKKQPLYIIPPRDQSTKTAKPRDVTMKDTAKAAMGAGTPRKQKDSPIRRPAKKAYCGKPVDTPLTQHAAKQGVLLEAIIIEYSYKQIVPQLFCGGGQKDTLSRLMKKSHFGHKHGDAFVFLNVTREWVQHLAMGDSKVWCSEWDIDETVLRDMESYVTRRYAELNMSKRSELKFSDDYDDTDSKLSSILLEQFADGLCVYRGHPELGFWSVSKWRTIYLHPASVLSQLGTSNKYILVLQDTSDTDLIHSAVPINDTTGESLLEKYKAAQEMLQLMTVAPVTIDRIGEVEQLRLMQQMEDPADGNLRQQMLNNCEGNHLILQTPQDKAYSRTSFTVYVSQADQEVTRALLLKEVEKMSKQGQNQYSELPYPNPDSPVRALVSAGGLVNRILLPHEYRSILIQETQRTGLTKDAVIKTLSPFGEIEHVIQYKQTGILNQGKWGMVVFKEPKAVQMTLASYATLDNMLVELTSLATTEESPLFVINHSVQVMVRVCRRPFDSGKVSVSFRATRDYSRATDAPAFFIKGVQVSGLRAQGKGQFLIEGLHKSTQEKDVRDGLSVIGLEPKEVIIHRKPAFKCITGELEKFKSALKRILDKVTDLRKVNVLVTKVQDEDIFLTANVVFANHRIATSSINSLCQARFQNLPLEVDVEETSDKTVKVLMEDKLYQILKPDLEKIIKVARRRLGFDVEVHSSSPTELHVTHSLPHKVEAALAEIEEVLRPTTVTVSKRWYNKLTRSDCEHLLSAVKAQSNTLIYWNKRKLDFYGPVKDRTEAVKLFRQYLAERHTWFQLRLSDLSVHSAPVCQCAAILSKKYGTELSKLKEECNLSNIVFNSHTKSLLISSDDSAAKESLGRVLKDCCPGYSDQSGESEGLPECSACFCTPESPDDVYYLAGCGHAYCTECVRQHVQHSIEGRNFPVMCAMDGCEKPMCNEDLLILADLAFKDGCEHLTKLTIDTFTVANKGEWCYCYLPICQGLVQKDERFHSYSCTVCYAKLCKKCLSQFHSGGCDEFHNNQALNQWFASSKDRKRCPKCSMGIEKVDGCNRVSCVACKQHICWVCLAYFTEMHTCYDHLNKEHGGY